jgi:hypothetical protein
VFGPNCVLDTIPIARIVGPLVALRNSQSSLDINPSSNQFDSIECVPYVTLVTRDAWVPINFVGAP